MNETTSFTACYLFLTDDCNMRCSYCFESTNRCNNSYMSLETAKKSVDFLIDNAIKHNIKLITLTFFGGEPLLNLDVMTKIFPYAVAKGNEYNIQVRFAIITNGTIYNKEYEKFLLDVYKATKYIDIQISTDGIPEVQDKNRVFIGNKPTSEVVLKNIIKLKSLFQNNQISTSSIRTHAVLTKDNLSSLFLSYKYFKQLGIKNCEFILVNEADWDEKDISIYSEQLSLITDYIYQQCVSTGSLEPYYEASGFAVQRRPNITKYTCEAGKALCSVAPNGDIYPCHRVYTYAPSKKIGNVFEGTVDENTVKRFFNTCREGMHAGNNSCGECQNTECVICMAYNNEKYGDMLKCSPSVCSMYKAKWNFIVETKKRFDKLYEKINYNKCNETTFFKSIN
ncbi:MAG: radical SAM protein [Deltaproteobacteria bacterium]